MRPIGLGILWLAVSLSKGMATFAETGISECVDSKQKKNQSIPAKNAKRITAPPMLLFMHEVMHQQQLPIIWPGSLHCRNPMPVLPLRP